MLITSRVCVASCWSRCALYRVLHCTARAGSCRPRRYLLESPSPGASSTDRSALPFAFSFHLLAMNPTLGIDSDSHLQWGWQSAPGGFKMAAAPVNDSGSNLHDHAAQHLDASARHPLRLAAERSYSTPPPCAPGLHPHGEPTPCSSHTAAAAVAGHPPASPAVAGGSRAATATGQTQQR